MSAAKRAMVVRRRALNLRAPSPTFQTRSQLLPLLPCCSNFFGVVPFLSISLLEVLKSLDGPPIAREPTPSFSPGAGGCLLGKGASFTPWGSVGGVVPGGVVLCWALARVAPATNNAAPASLKIVCMFSSWGVVD